MAKIARSWCGLTRRFPGAIWWCSDIDAFERRGCLGKEPAPSSRTLKDSDHLVAQGQENSARANLSFIEKATYASEIARLHFDGDNAIVLSALSADRATLSKMLAVANMPRELLDAGGAAKDIGRDRWYELKTLL